MGIRRKIGIPLLANIILLISCYKTQNVHLDKKATILINSEYNTWLDKNYGYKVFTPSNKDFLILDSIMNIAIDKGKFNFVKKPIKKYLKKYYRQYIPYTNDQNEKVIEINAFCEILEIPPSTISDNNKFTKIDWKDKYISVEDGGYCYWSITINIKTKEFEI